MKKLLFTLVVMLSLAACSTDDTEQPAPQKVSVEMTVIPDTRAMVESRAADESAIEDLNFYLVDKKGNTAVHLYQSSPMIRFECVPGDYRVRIVANIGRDLGKEADLENLTIDYENDYQTLPMACDEERSIVAGASSIELKRCVAKVSYEIAAVPEDIELKSVELVSVPAKYAPFVADAAPSENPSDYMTTAQTLLTGREASGTYYLFPNPQGTNPAITDQKDKNPENAPENATYFLIRASKGGELLTYIVYLGANNVSDFNVLANRHYRMKISLMGGNETDTRVIAYTLKVYDDYERYKYGDYCIYFPISQLHVEIADNDSNMDLKGTYKLIDGEESAVRFDDFRGGQGPDFTMMMPNGHNYFGMQYHPQVFTRENAHFAYQVTLRDDFGICEDVILEHNMANDVQIYPGDGGEIISSDALHCETIGTGSTLHTLVLCYEDGCTLTATPHEYYQFLGWYADRQYTQKLSDNASYKFVPTEVSTNIYARFHTNGIPLDKNGTSNCYITPSLNTRYSFDATVMGNGAVTSHIEPKPISGATAKVIWETGTKAGAVIKNVGLVNGRIFIDTGDHYGNALVGLFNANDECVWSWHIWSTDYDPEEYAQTYFSGATFMDRDLGAMNNTYDQRSNYGTFYQWGRKDPFLQGIDDTPAIYLAGYEYSHVDPDTGGFGDHGQEIMNVEWATAHPTAEIGPNLYLNIIDWQYDDRPYSWGNRTTSEDNVIEKGEKSIYDPCPPGWKMPNPADFQGITKVTDASNKTYSVFYSESRATIYKSYPYWTDAPYRWSFVTNSVIKYGDRNDTSIFFRDHELGSYSDYRTRLCPVRCIRE